MFNRSKVTSLDLYRFDTSNVTNMRYMFATSQIDQGDFFHFNTNNVIEMYGMFKDTLFQLLDLSSFNTSLVTDMSNVTESTNMFSNATKLPNYSSSYIDKTKAHYDEGGYLTYKANT